MSLLRLRKFEPSGTSGQPPRLPHRWAIIIGFSLGAGFALSRTVSEAVGVPAAIALAVFLHHALE